MAGSRLSFGTDGMRGVANAELTPELAMALGRAVGRVLRPREVVVGRDTRLSGPLLQSALAAGLAAEGVDVIDLGVVPTPAVAFYAEQGGAMVSGSHNPSADNGIKVFAAGGRKLSEEVEEALEAELDRAGGVPRTGEAIGRIHTRDEIGTYVDHLTSSLDGRSLAGLRVVLDCANGAASTVAPFVFTALGADVTAIHAEPDGVNINARCGSTYPADLQDAVVDLGADAGLAFDGDADRVLAVDAAGQLVDGDHIIAVCALDLHDRGRLAGDTVVVTVMTNLGFRLAMQERGVKVIETPVGDRNVLTALADGDWCLGGEQSGHVIFPEYGTTGDGILTGIQLLDVVARTRRPLGDLASVMTRVPQVLRNVEASGELDLTDEITAAEAELGPVGRVLVRRSGTEPVVRVMVEALDAALAERVADRLVAAVTGGTAPTL